MDKILQKPDSSALAQAIDTNIHQFYTQLGLFSSEEIYQDEAFFWVITGFIGLNLILRAPSEPVDIEDHMEQIKTFFRLRKTLVVWHEAPSPAICRYLEASGWRQMSEMVRGMADLQTSFRERVTSPDFFCAPVSTQEGIRCWAETIAKSHWLNEQRKARWLDAHLHLKKGTELPWQYYVAWFKEQPVATALLFPHAGVVGLHMITIVPEMRGRRIIEAMTSVLIHDVRTSGYRYIVGECRPSLVPLYRHLGWQPLYRLPLYIWQPTFDPHPTDEE
jgi:hypothetical protein